MSIGRVFSQLLWPDARDPDDCWIIAVIQAIAGVAPWLSQPDITTFRAAAGKPDVQGVANPGNELDMMKGIRGTPGYATIAPLVELVSGESWATFIPRFRAYRTAALIVSSAKLSPNYGFTGIHAIAASYVGGPAPTLYRADNGLAPAYTWPQPVTEAYLQAAVTAYEGSVHGVLMPAELDALKVHPLAVQLEAAAVAKWTAWLAAHP